MVEVAAVTLAGLEVTQVTAVQDNLMETVLLGLAEVVAQAQIIMMAAQLDFTAAAAALVFTALVVTALVARAAEVLTPVAEAVVLEELLEDQLQLVQLVLEVITAALLVGFVMADIQKV
jgi:hypothetical protein